MTPSPLSSSLNYFSSKPNPPLPSRFTSTARAGASQLGWRSTTPCVPRLPATPPTHRSADERRTQMNFISCPVHTIVIGQASSMASLILAGGEPGHRSALPHSSVMIHRSSFSLLSPFSPSLLAFAFRLSNKKLLTLFFVDRTVGRSGRTGIGHIYRRASFPSFSSFPLLLSP